MGKNHIFFTLQFSSHVQMSFRAFVSLKQRLFIRPGFKNTEKIQVTDSSFDYLFVSSFASFFHLSAALSAAVFRQYFRVFFGDKPKVSIFQARWKLGERTFTQGNVPALLIHVLVATILERTRARDHRRWATQMARRHKAKCLPLKHTCILIFGDFSLLKNLVKIRQ